MDPSETRQIKAELQQYRQHNNTLKQVAQIQELPEWQAFKEYITQQAHIGLPFDPYHGNMSAGEIAIRNEMKRHYQEGMLKALTFVDDEMAHIQSKMTDLEAILKGDRA